MKCDPPCVGCNLIRWLRDVGFWEQVKVIFKLLRFGPAYGKRMERLRLLSRLKLRFHITLTCIRLQKLSTAAPKRRLSHLAHHEREKNLLKKAEAKAPAVLAAKRFEARRRMLSHPKALFFMDCFPVRVLAKNSSGTWIEGVCHGVDESGNLRVATGEGSALTFDAYKSGFVIPEQNRAVKITSELLTWTRQQNDSVNAISAAPLGAFGRIQVRNTNHVGAGVEAGQPLHQSAAAFSVPPTSIFTFFFDLSQPAGFELQSKWSSIVAKDVVRGGQSNIAGMVNHSRICRVGGTRVATAQGFELAVVKRRIVSALLRREKLAVDNTSTATPLTEEDEELLANDEVVSLIKPPEMASITKELTQTSGGDTCCTLSFTDPRYGVTRRLPTEVRDFHRLATMVQADPYWDCFAPLLSRFKSSSRHFEQWVNIRKMLAVIVGVFLESHSALVPASAMLVICVFALVLQIRLQPYDDSNPRNMFNPADALLGNNHLELVLITLQIAQLVVGIMSVQIKISEGLLAALYISIFVLGILFSLVALSNRFAKGAAVALKSLEPVISALNHVLGVSGGGVGDYTEDDARVAAEKMLAAARSYEQSTVVKFQQSKAVFEHISQITGASANRLKALQEHREELAQKKNETRRESTTWENRRRSSKSGATFATEVEEFRRKSVTHNTQAGEERHRAQVEKQKAKYADSEFMAFQADAWKKRQEREGPTTKAEELGHFSIRTQAGEERHRAQVEEQKAKYADSEFMAFQSHAWKKRQEREGHTTKAEELGHFSTHTRVSIQHKLDREENKRLAIERSLEAEKEREAVARLWEKRQKSQQGGGTKADELGNFSKLTESEVLRRVADEKAKEERHSEATRALRDREAWEKRRKSRHATKSLLHAEKGSSRSQSSASPSPKKASDTPKSASKKRQAAKTGTAAVDAIDASAMVAVMYSDSARKSRTSADLTSRCDSTHATKAGSARNSRLGTFEMV